MRKLIVLVCLMAGASTNLFSQESESKEEDKNQELKEQSVYSEEEKESMPKSFTLDPMIDPEKEVEPEELMEETETSTEPEINEVATPEEMEEPVEVEEADFHTDSKNYSSNTYQYRDEIQTLAGKNHHSGGFGALSFKATSFHDKNIVMAGFRGGWIINRSFAIGIDGYGIIPTAEYGNIDPFFNTRAVGGYGGLFLEPILFSNKIIHVTFPVSGGAGWLGYLYDWEDVGYNRGGELVDGDVFWYIEPGAALELNVSRNFRMNFGASYRFTQDLTLINTPSSAFDDWNYFLTLKFGRF